MAKAFRASFRCIVHWVCRRIGRVEGPGDKIQAFRGCLLGRVMAPPSLSDGEFESATQGRLADEEQREVGAGVHVGVGEQPQRFERSVLDSMWASSMTTGRRERSSSPVASRDAVCEAKTPE